MSARAVIVLLAAMMIVPGVAAVVDPMPMGFDMGDDVNDVAVAFSGDRFAGASDDPTGQPAGLSGYDEPVYRVWEQAGGIRIIGNTDPQECDAPLLSTDCQHHATHIALRADGGRVAVGSFISANRGSTLVLDADGTGPTRFGSYLETGMVNRDTEIEGRMTAIDMSDSGHRVAASTRIDGVAPEGRVYLYQWGGAPALNKTVELGDVVLDVAMSPDGKRYIAGGDDQVYRFNDNPGDSTVRADNAPGLGTSTSVAIATGPGYRSIAGHEQGGFTLYTGLDTGRAYFVDFGSGTPVTAVDIARAGDRIAVGTQTGTLRVYDLPADMVPAQIAHITDLPGPVTDLEFSGDGASLVVASTPRVSLYHITASSVQKVWDHNAAAGIGRVAIDQAGEAIASGHGDDVTLYQADHDVRASVAGAIPQVRPDSSTNITVQVRNDGNRVEQVVLTPTHPQGWDVKTDTDTYTVMPDTQRGIPIQVDVPAGTPPGTYQAGFTFAYSGESGELELDLTVPTVRAWRLDPVGATSLSISSGAPASFRLEVANEGNVAGTTGIQLSGLPPGWSATTEPNSVTVAAGATREVTVSVDAPAGVAQLAQAMVRASLTEDASQSETLTATVGARFGVALDVPSGVQLGAGIVDTFEVTVENTGNAVDSYRISVGDLPSGWRASFANGLTTLAINNVQPGASQDVLVSVQTPATATPQTQVQLRVTVASLGDPGESVERSMILGIEETEDPDNGTPGVPLVALLAALAVAVARRRP